MCRSYRRLLWAIAALALALPCFSALRADEPPAKSPPAAAGEPAAKKAKPKITVSKETTFVLGPLNKDGTVDFVAALDGLMSQGVTPEKNAAIPLWQAFGPKDIPEKDREAFFKRLGIPPLPTTGDYFVPLMVYVSQPSVTGQAQLSEAKMTELQQAADAQQEQACERPWSEKEFPRLAAWLEVNRKPLELIEEATRRPRLYSPLFPLNSRLGLSVADFQLAQWSRDAARTLATRAMLRLGSGHLDEALEDAMACHRLARLVGSGPFLVDSLVAIADDGIACSIDRAIAEHGKMSAENSKKYQARLERLPPLRMNGGFSTGERLLALDIVCRTMTDDPGKSVKDLAQFYVPVLEPTGKLMPRAKEIAELASRQDIDWNVVLRQLNSWYDRVAEATAKTTVAERHKALVAIDADIHALLQQKASNNDNVKEQSPRNVSREIADFLASFFHAYDRGAGEAENRQSVHLELTKLALALSAYRDEHGGKYPAKLAELSPKYIAAVPADPFTGEDLHYKPSGKGYLLYSVGPNGKDDGGREISDPSDPPGDDIAVRVPRSEK